MGRRSKLTYAERLSAVLEYKKGAGSYNSIAKKYGIDESTLRAIVAIYDSQGQEGLLDKKKNKKYSKELRLQAVKDYLSGKGSLLEICKKHKIFSKTQLRNWIKVYNGHKEFKERTSSKGEIYMTKGRNTTHEERIEIVAFCIEHGKDYGLTTETYKVSYQQIYSWVKKYEEHGVAGLADNRGKSKPESKMTEADRLRAENKILEAKLKDKEMELALLKKLAELEGM